jgi:hypothetical protein
VKHVIEQYDARANSPGTWWWFGKNLFTAADLLRPHWQGTQMRTSVAVYGPMQMLRACATECMLKALCLDAGQQFASGGQFGKANRSHVLVDLLKGTRLSCQPDEVAVLEKLQRYITAGRYPVELNWRNTYPPPRATDDPMMAWSKIDEDVFDRLRQRLQEQDERMCALE